LYRVLREDGKLVLDKETLMPLGEIKKLAEDSDFYVFEAFEKDCPNFRERELGAPIFIL